MTTETELRQEFLTRAGMAGLTVDCNLSGPPSATIVIVGEAPGEREASMKSPMTGPSGQRLWKCLEEIGIKRRDCYVTNVVKRQLALAGGDKLQISSQEIEHWRGLLNWELSQLPNAKIIIALGNVALEALTHNRGITNWRGSVLYWCGIPIVPTFNPAMVLREPKWEPIFRFDIHKVDRVLRGKHHVKQVETVINLGFADAVREIRHLHDTADTIAWDIEVIGNETACIGFAASDTRGVCINFRDASTNLYTMEEEREIRLEIARLFAKPGIRWIAQNGNFDSYWVWYKDRIKPPTPWIDTLLAHHTLYPSLPHNLGFLTSQYTNFPYHKGEKDDWREGGDIDSFWRYNCKDATVTWAIAHAIEKELIEQKLDDFFYNHVMRLLPHLSMMTVLGIKIDEAYKSNLVDDLRVDIEKYKEKFITLARAATGDEELVINPRSPKQLKELLFDRLKLIGRGFATDDENRERIMRHPKTPEVAREMLKALTTYKEQDKFLGTYADMEIDPDGRARCEYKQYGTQAAPGRLSSTKTLWGTGMNLQNQPERAHKMFITDTHPHNGIVYEFSYCDASQAEARVVAWLWHVKQLKENFIQGFKDKSFDIHRGNASAIFKLPYEAIPSYDRLVLGEHTNDPLEAGKPTKRFLGKRCVHGLNYRMQAPKLADVCGIPLVQAVDAFNAYHHAFPEIKAAWAETISRARKDRALWTPMGRRMIFLEPLYSDDQLDSIIAFVPQSTIGDKISSVIYQCHEDPDWPRTNDGKLEAVVKLNIHDAIISMHLPQHGEQVRAVMRKHMESPIIINGEPVTIPAEFKKSVPDEQGIHRWSSLEKVKNVG